MSLYTQPIKASTAKHPLATQQGVNLLMQYLFALEGWSDLTPKQRELLLSVESKFTKAKETAARHSRRVHLPLLPKDAHPRTLAALQRRGFVDADGRLTDAGGVVLEWGMGSDRRAEAS